MYVKGNDKFSGYMYVKGNDKFSGYMYVREMTSIVDTCTLGE